jgi:hypothetical protein
MFVGMNKEDIAMACGYIPIIKFLHPGETILQTLNIGDDYFALTKYDRLLYICNWYGESDEIQVPHVAREVKDILADKEYGDKFHFAIFEYFKYLRGISLRFPSSNSIIMRLMDLTMFSEQQINIEYWNQYNNDNPPQVYEYPYRGVYFIQAINGLIKIGRSVNINARFKQLATMSPIDLSIMAFIKTEDECALELELHKLFASKRCHGEWFDLSESDLMAANDSYGLNLSIN